MTEIKILTIKRTGEDEGQLDLSYIADGNENWFSHAENSKQFLRQLNIFPT